MLDHMLPGAKIVSVLSVVAIGEITELVNLESVGGLGIMGVGMLYAFRISTKSHADSMGQMQKQVDRLTEENKRVWARMWKMQGIDTEEDQPDE